MSMDIFSAQGYQFDQIPFEIFQASQDTTYTIILKTFKFHIL
jgi:hypothetical protein